MKKSLVARGIIGAVASLLGVAAVGCGADVGDGAAGDSAEIGSTAEALILTNSPGVNLAGPAAQFGGYAKIPSTNKVLWLGGYLANGNATNVSGIFDPTLTGAARFTILHDKTTPANASPIPTSLGEVEVVLIPGTTDQFLVTGGRTAVDGTGDTFTRVVKVKANGTNFDEVEWFTPGQLPSGRVFGLKTIKQCGTSKLIAFGGMTEAGMEDRVNLTATDEILVYTPNTTTPASGSWATLKDGSNNVVKLQKTRGYHEVYAASTTQFRIAGGANADSATDAEAITAAGGTSNVEKLTVNSSCVATSEFSDINAGAGIDMRTDYGNALPNPRSRMTSIAKSIVGDFTNDGVTNNVTYEFLVAGGTDSSSSPSVVPTPAFVYDLQNDAWRAMEARVGTNKPTQGRAFPRLIELDANNVLLLSGIQPDAASTTIMYDTTGAIVIDKLETASTAAAWKQTSLSNLDHSRVGTFAELLNSLPHVGAGALYDPANLPTTLDSTVESH